MPDRIQAASFRDPSGRLAVLPERVVRWVRESGRADFEAFIASDAVSKAVSDGRVIGTQTVAAHERQALAEQVGWPDAATDGLVVQHDRIPFASYPYEWPREMLEAAATLTLDLHDLLLGEDLGLKDATPYNVLFDGPKPVFIDVLSVEKRHPQDPIWTPYGQFIRTFLLPLLVERDHALPLSVTLSSRRDGLQPEEVYRLAGRVQRLSSPYRSLVTLPTWLAGQAEAKGEAVYEPKRLNNPEQAKFILHAVVRRLRRALRRVRPRKAKTSNWSDYMATRGHYDDADAARKDAFVQKALEAGKPRWVLDVGCNTGHFSRMAAKTGARVVGIDLDPVSVGQVWTRAREENLDILPLVVDLSRPTPALGWRNAECPSFLDRAQGRFDMVFLLAVMHHLHVTERIPLAEILDLVAELSRRDAVFEYVGPKDPMFRKLLRGRAALHADLSREGFEALVRERFHVVHAEPLQGSDRVLYHLRRLDAREEAPMPTTTAATNRPAVTPPLAPRRR